MDEVIDEVNGEKIINIKNELEKLPLDLRIIKYKEVLRIMAEISIDHNTDELKKHIERLTSIKENLPDDIINPVSTVVEKHQNTIWFKLGVLFAQGKIIQKGFNYFYESIEFNSERSISLYIGKNILNIKNPNSVRPFLHDTLKDIDSDKNIYTYDRINRIYKYCKNNNIQMCDLFISKQKNIKRY